MMKKSILSAALTACIVAIAGCDDARRELPPPPTITGNLLLLTDNNELASIDVDKSDKLVSKESIKGLKTGDSLVGLDYRPADGKLYAIGYLGNIYTIDTTTTTAEFKKALKANLADATAPFTAITGDKSQIAVNFDPLTDRLRLVGSNGQNLRIDVETGDTTTDGTISADATVTAIAHTNSFVGTGSTRLFDIDVKQDRLFLQSSPNDGTLGASAALGVIATGSSGLVINGVTNEAFAVLTVNGVQQLYNINLNSIGTQNNAASLTDPNKLKGKLPALGNIHAIALEQNRGIISTAVGLSKNNELVIFNTDTPTDTDPSVTIKGLSAGENIVGIDYRSSGLLYALSSMNNLYLLDARSGTLYMKKPLTAASTDITLPFTGLSGSSFAVDFDPQEKQLRVISNTGQNLRINVDDTAKAPTTTDDALNGIPDVQVSAAAHTNNFTGTTTNTTKLFNLDRNNNQLTLQTLPSTGTLTAVGALGIPLGNATGFDIVGGDNGLALAVVNVGETNTSSLYKINLATGKAEYAIHKDGLPDTPDPEKSKIGTATTPALIDIALIQK